MCLKKVWELSKGGSRDGELKSSSELITGCDYICSTLPVYGGSGNNYCDLSLWWPYTRACSVTSVTPYKSLLCHFGDHTQEFHLSVSIMEIFYVALGSSKNFALLVWVGGGLLKRVLYIFDNEPRSGQKSPILHLPQEFVLGQLSVQHCRASYHSRSTEPVIGPFLQNQ